MYAAGCSQLCCGMNRMNTNANHLEITGALRAADLSNVVDVRSGRASHAPIARNQIGWPEPADEQVWIDLERMLAAREAARSAHPAGRGNRAA